MPHQMVFDSFILLFVRKQRRDEICCVHKPKRACRLLMARCSSFFMYIKCYVFSLVLDMSIACSSSAQCKLTFFSIFFIPFSFQCEKKRNLKIAKCRNLLDSHKLRHKNRRPRMKRKTKKKCEKKINAAQVLNCS